MQPFTEVWSHRILREELVFKMCPYFCERISQQCMLISNCYLHRGSYHQGVRRILQRNNHRILRHHHHAIKRRPRAGLSASFVVHPNMLPPRPSQSPSHIKKHRYLSAGGNHQLLVSPCVVQCCLSSLVKAYTHRDGIANADTMYTNRINFFKG
jgi:hypothetical protein